MIDQASKKNPPAATRGFNETSNFFQGTGTARVPARNQRAYDHARLTRRTMPVFISGGAR